VGSISGTTSTAGATQGGSMTPFQIILVAALVAAAVAVLVVLVLA
jgi:hypothetical protein